MSKKRKLRVKILFRLTLIITQLNNTLRIYYYRLLGSYIGCNCKIGKIEISVPEQVSISENCILENNVRLRVGGGWKKAFIKIGKSTFLGHSTQINVGSAFIIGDNCLIAPLCIFTDANHGFENMMIQINRQNCNYDRITIEDDVWIGSGSIVLAGVKISKGAVVGAGSIVTKSIPAYEVWAGVPAKKIKDRN